MASRRTHRIVNALALLVGGVCLSAAVGAGVLVTAPTLAFAHSAGDGRITFHDTRPLPQEAAERAAAEAWAALQDTPFGQPDHGVDVFIVEGGWRHRLFFAGALWAGGLTYPAFWQDRVFLRDVDLEAGRVIYEGAVVPPPRDLTYYLVHEITHLRHAEVMGGIAMFMGPQWVREGVPDVAALGPAGPELMAAAMAGEDLRRTLHGSYPVERVCVTMVLAQPGMTMERLLQLDVPMRDPGSCFTLPQVRAVSD